MKSVFITGGTTGIGMELAKIYLHQGWKVGVCGRDKVKFQDSFPNETDRPSFYQVDVSNRDELRAAVKDFSTSIGLDLMIANAGIGYKYKTKIPDFAYSYKMVHINFLGVMYAFEAALDYMIPRSKGQLVAMSSIAGFNGLPGASAYSATKSAVTKYCESLTLDLKPFGIDVTTICPGFVDTPLTKQNRHPMPFIMQADQAAEKMVRAISKKKMIYCTPFLLSTFVKFMSFLPRTWYRALMTIKFFNYSKDKA